MERKVSLKALLAVMIVLVVISSTLAYNFYEKEPYYICRAESGKIEMNLGDYAVLTTSPDSLDENDDPKDGDSLIHFYESNGDYKASIFIEGIYESVHFDFIDENSVGICDYNIFVSKASNDSRDFYKVDEYNLVELKFGKENKMDIEYSSIVSSSDEYIVYDTDDYLYPGLGNNYAGFLVETGTFFYSYVEVNGSSYSYSYFDQRTSRIK